MLRFSGTGRSDVGLVRADNEDSGFVGPTLLLVADGVGGNAGGEVASATTAYVVSTDALTHVGAEPATVLNRAVAYSNHEVAAGVQASPDLHGMATTLTAVLTDGEQFALAHVGDSRGYVSRDGELTRVTTDHTWVHGMVDSGRMSEEEAAVHPWRNVVLRTVNGEPDADAVVVPLSLRAGDRVLLCSDGVTDLVSETRLEQVLDRYADDAAADTILDAALAAGGRDNITVVIATVIDGPRVAVDGQLLGAVCQSRNILDAPAATTHATA